ncbi:MAG: hypothetical protein IV090_01325 [Candidatus Sericytochromatia bacterium]|nr:hypothetical protein [Candidatus Sericytochromatia bacterium]
MNGNLLVAESQFCAIQKLTEQNIAEPQNQSADDNPTQISAHFKQETFKYPPQKHEKKQHANRLVRHCFKLLQLKPTPGNNQLIAFFFDLKISFFSVLRL